MRVCVCGVCVCLCVSVLAVLTNVSVCVYRNVRVCVYTQERNTFIYAWELVAVLHDFSLFFNFCGDVYCKIRTWFSLVKL